MKKTRITRKQTYVPTNSKRHMTAYYERLRAEGKKVFTIVTPESTIPILKLFNQQLILAWEKERAQVSPAKRARR